jgi:glutathione S-transferase
MDGMSTRLIIGNKNYSTWSLRAWLLLSEAGIEFEEERLALDTEGFADKIAQFSPASNVPVLILNGATVWDTMAIAETAAEHWPDRNLWPSNPAARAHARSISAEMHSGFSILREAMPMNCRAMGRKVSLPDALAADIDRVFEIWSDCHRRYQSGGDWLFGEFSVADAMYAPVVLRFRSYGINLPESAAAYPDRLLQSTALQDWLAAAESEVEVIEREEIGK